MAHRSAILFTVGLLFVVQLGLAVRADEDDDADDTIDVSDSEADLFDDSAGLNLGVGQHTSKVHAIAETAATEKIASSQPCPFGYRFDHDGWWTNLFGYGFSTRRFGDTAAAECAERCNNDGDCFVFHTILDHCHMYREPLGAAVKQERFETAHIISLPRWEQSSRRTSFASFVAR